MVSHTLLGLNLTMCHPWITLFQFHGSIVPGILLGTLWIIAGFARLKELRRLKHVAHLRSIDHSRPKSTLPPPSITNTSTPEPATKLAAEEATALPVVSVILPTRGCRSHSLANWRSFLDMHYGGAIEFIFVLESKADPANAAISKMLRDAMSSRRQARILFAGQSTNTSQKIHNLIAGIKAATPASQYILCLDDDVQLHPAALSSLIDDMENQPETKVATGYPFDVPPPQAALLTYCVLCYHLPLVIAFSINQRTDFVWGGCMLFRAQELRQDTLGVLSSWADGGYSDDLTVASKCNEAGKKVWCPSYAIFPQWLDDTSTIKSYWNYLRRQLYVLDTYAGPQNKRTNHILAAFHVYASLAFVLPATTAVLRLVLWAATLLVLPMQRVHDGEEAYRWIQWFGIGSHIENSTGPGSSNNTECEWSFVSWVIYIATWVYMALALKWLTGVVLELFKELNPALKRRRLDTFDWPKLWLAFYLSNVLLPWCMVYTFVTRHIDWAGIRYYRKDGKVVRVDHSGSHIQGSGGGGKMH